MSQPTRVVDPSATSPRTRFRQAVAAGLVVGVVVFIGLVLGERAPLMMAGLLAVAAGLAMLRWPDLATLVAIGLIYSNLPVVAVKFHGAPGVLPAAALGMLLWPFLYRVLLRKEPVCLDSASPFVAMLVLVQLAGAMLARSPQTAFEHLVSFLLEGVLLYFLLTNVIRTRRMAIATFWVLAGCALLMGGVPGLQQLTGRFDSAFGGLAQVDSLFQTAEDAVEGIVRQARAAGTIGEQNRYSQFMLMLVPVGLSLTELTKSGWLRVLAIAATLAALLGFALGFSRGAAVGLVLALGLALWLNLLNRTQIKFVLAGGAIVLLLLPQYLTRLSSLGSVIGIVTHGDVQGQSDGAIRGRLTEMWAAVLVWRDHPMVGVGPGMFTEYSQEYGQRIGLRSLAAGRQAHSMPLDIAAEHGILGLVAVGGVLASVIYGLVRARNTAIRGSDLAGSHLATGMLMMVLIYLTTGLFLHLSYIRYFWLLIALADAVRRIVADGDRGTDSLPMWRSPVSSTWCR